jgi:hypothetical protein
MAAARKDLDKLAYFTGAKFWETFKKQLAEYPSTDAMLTVWKDERGAYWIGVCDEAGGDPINDSHICPGSPGC